MTPLYIIPRSFYFRAHDPLYHSLFSSHYFYISYRYAYMFWTKETRSLYFCAHDPLYAAVTSINNIISYRYAYTRFGQQGNPRQI